MVIFNLQNVELDFLHISDAEYEVLKSSQACRNFDEFFLTSLSYRDYTTDGHPRKSRVDSTMYNVYGTEKLDSLKNNGDELVTKIATKLSQ